MAFQEGDKLAITVQITEKMVQQFAECSGDFNPMHMDEEYAKKTIYGKRIAHGMLTGALISRALAQELGPGGVYLSQTIKFAQPVFIGDDLTIELSVDHLKKSNGTASIGTLVTNQKGEVVVKGSALIMQGDFIIKKD